MTDKAPSQLSEHSQSEVHASAFKPAEHPVTALALLRVPAWEPERLAAQLDLDWNIKAEPVPTDSRKPWLFRVNGSLVVIGFEGHLVPGNAADEQAKNCPDWPDAQEMASTHLAYLALAVVAEEATLVENARTAMKILGSLTRQPNVSAINSAGRLFEPERFRSDVLTMQHSETAFPIFNIVFFGLWQREEDAPLSGYTLGLDRFACPDLEILESPDAPAVIRAQMIAAAMVQITRGAALKDGEVLTLSGTIFKAELKASSAVPGAVTTHLTAIEKAPESEAPKKKKRF